MGEVVDLGRVIRARADLAQQIVDMRARSERDAVAYAAGEAYNDWCDALLRMDDNGYDIGQICSATGDMIKKINSR